MKRLGLCAALLGVVNCMGVEVPEDYVSDMYYAGTTQVASVTPSTSMSWTTLSQTLRIQFNNPMAASSLVADSGGSGAGNLYLYDNNNAGYRAITSVSWEKRDSILIAAFSGGDLDPNSDYTITVGASMTDFRGATLGTDATFPFKSGVPTGYEPRVVSVTAAQGSPTWDITIVFSRNIQVASLITPQENICGSNIELTGAGGVCNPLYRTLTTSGNPTIKVGYKQPPSSGTWTFTVKKDVLDRFSIPLTADYTATIVIP